MFNNDEEYLNATRDAKINRYKENILTKDEQSFNKGVFLNLFIIVILVSFGVLFYKKQTDFFPKKAHTTAVLGVSKTIDDSEFSDEELLKILKVTEVDMLEESRKEDESHELTNLANSMQVLVNESTIQSPSSYSDAIARELDDKSGFKGRIVVVKKGDTLSSLSEKFYGNPMQFFKIIHANKNLTDSTSFLKVGQRINIPD